MLRVGSEYNAELQKMVNRVRKSIEAELVPAVYAEEPNYTADAWPQTIQAIIERLLRQYDSPLFEVYARRLAEKFVTSSLGFADRQNRRSFGIEVFNGSSTKLNNYMQAAITQNTNLIKSIPQRYLEDVGNTVQTGMRNGVLPREIAKSIQENHGVSSRRAKFIARDQAAKVNGEISKQRQIDAGFEYFTWVDAHDQRVRHRHREIADADNGMGKGVYKWSDLPKSSEGTTIQPGSDYNCRCIARPVRSSVVEKTINERKQKKV